MLRECISINQSINLYRAMVQKRVLVQLCPIKEKCLKTDLKCVNGWSSSTVQWKNISSAESIQERQDISAQHKTDRR